MSLDEQADMDEGRCIFQLRGVRPFFGEKYDVTKLPLCKYLADPDKKNIFSMEKYMQRRKQFLKKDEVFDMYEIPIETKPRMK